MSKLIDEINDEELVALLIGSGGDVGLAAERLCGRLEVQYGEIKEYDLLPRIAKFDLETSDLIASKLRLLLTIQLYSLLTHVGSALQGSLGDLRPAELARAHASLANTFTAITAPATKVTFDFEGEITKLAEEFKLPAEEIRGNLKAMEQKLRTPK